MEQVKSKVDRRDIIIPYQLQQNISLKCNFHLHQNIMDFQNYTPSTQEVFDNRDIAGNESPLCSESESDPETLSTTETQQNLSTVMEQPSQDFVIPTLSKSDILSTKIKNVLKEMENQNIHVAEFLDGLSWGDADCNKDRGIINARTSLLSDPILPSILHRWAFPPRPSQSKHRRPEDAQSIMKEFAIDYIQRTTNKELQNLAPTLQSATDEDVNSDRLASTTYKELSDDMHQYAPVLWKLLETLAIDPNSR